MIRTPLLLAAALAAPAFPAAAHQAPSGWRYDAICCSNQDCRPISAREVEATARGWRIKRTGALVPFSQARQSKDGAFHWCTVDGSDNGKTICLYAPDMTN